MNTYEENKKGGASGRYYWIDKPPFQVKVKLENIRKYLIIRINSELFLGHKVLVNM